MLMTIPFSYTTGHGSGWGNIGSMFNRGIELSASYDIISNKDMFWSVSANINYNKNEITELFGGRDEYVVANTGLKYEVGKPYGEFYYVRWVGVDPQDGQQIWLDKDGNETKVYDENNAAYTGKQQYAPWSGGFSTRFDWKGFSVNADFSFMLGKYMIDNDRYFVENPNFVGQLNQTVEMENMWTTPGQVTDIAAVNSPRYFDTHLLENASFLRLKNLTIGYNLPQSLLRKTGFIRGYLGKTIQVIPHITDEIKRNVKLLGNKYKFDFVITEIGGTVGDIESLPYLESIRQLKWELGKNALCVHLTYVPYLAAAGELKTKPTQHSVKELQSVGIQPDVLVLRAEHPLSDGLRKKVAQFCNVDDKAVVQSIDAETIYEVPLLMQAQGLDSTILEKMGLPVGETPGLGPWRKFLERRHAAETKEPINIALVGKYDLQDAYKSIREALSQAGTYNDRKVEVHFVNSEKLTDENVAEALKGMAGVMIGPGFGQRGIDGKFVAIKYTRTHDIPTFGICLGMQCIAIEFARNVLGYADADSREMDEKTPHNVIDIMEEQKAITNMGGTMRLGAYECVLQKGSKAYLAYGEEHIQERHRHRYEFNNDYKAQYEAAGMKCVGINPESDLVEIVEIPALKWFIGTQFHPEYSSTVLNPHPLFVAFVKAAIENEKN